MPVRIAPVRSYDGTSRNQRRRHASGKKHSSRPARYASMAASCSTFGDDLKLARVPTDADCCWRPAGAFARVRPAMSSNQTLIAERPVVVACDQHSVARLLDSTLLKTDATRDQVLALCEEAARFDMATVFVHPSHIALAHSVLRGTGTKVGTPVGFPLGASLTTTKRFEAEEALRLGAQELDLVMNVGALKSGDRRLVENDIRAVAEITRGRGAVLKVILETPLLALEEKIIACELSVLAGADFVKTCTGFAGGGATTDDIHLMRGVVGDRAGVKAAGGIRSAAEVQRMLDAGADRIGTSTAAQILRELSAV